MNLALQICMKNNFKIKLTVHLKQERRIKPMQNICNYEENKNIKKLQVVITKVLKPAIKTSFLFNKTGHKINQNFITFKLHLSLTVCNINHQILKESEKLCKKSQMQSVIKLNSF